MSWCSHAASSLTHCSRQFAPANPTCWQQLETDAALAQQSTHAVSRSAG